MSPGISSPSIPRTVGARSDSSPPSRSPIPSSVTTSGTGFEVCAVCGLVPSGSSITLAFPWSAVTRHTPPAAWTHSTTRSERVVRRLESGHDRRYRARVPDHVGVREVDDREAVPVPIRSHTRSQPRRPTSRASGRRSGRCEARGRGSGSPLPIALLAAVEEVRHVRVLLGPATWSWRTPRPRRVTSASVFRTSCCSKPQKGRELVPVRVIVTRSTQRSSSRCENWRARFGRKLKRRCVPPGASRASF